MYGPSGHTIVVNCEFTIYISNYPSVENSVLKYSGGVQTPVFVNYDESQLDISGTYSATNAGEYTAIFTPKTGYAFEDGSASKEVPWGIYYIWEKYNVDTNQSTVYTDTITKTNQRYSVYSNTLKGYKKYSFDAAIGKYTVSGSSVTYSMNSGDMYSNLSSGYKYAIGNSTSQLYEITAVSNGYDALNYSLHEAKSSTITNYSKGSTSYGQVYSTNASEYPDNNKSGDYWYVKQ